ncbi:glycoside hydrolase family 9 protein [Cohnella sp. 56]|uniref:glycoside hydrolase family 9 protein n=1 Tax=Cohnella sp. 56 TaxID=3113722 RepID=UPI0030E94C2E
MTLTKRNYKSIWLALLCLCLFAGSWPGSGAKASAAEALPGVTVQKYIMIDQFGYLPDGDKVAVLVDPQVGFNAADAYTPGSTMQVRRVSDDAVVFSGAPTVWNGGRTQEKSGDRGWWFDFSQVTAVGDYYIYDPAGNVKSYNFTISPDVYKEVLKAAIKTFYYQRIGTPHLAQHAGAAFADDAALIGPGQDSQARSVFDRNNPATERDLSGGWMDAGDYNKYVTYTAQPINELLSAYEEKPDIFTDDYNIPESGNGIPDIIDEVKWELDWLKKMQDEDGGVLMKVGFPSYGKTGDYNDRPSQITFQRYYLPKTSASTIVTALNFAHASITLRQFPELASYAADLRERAIKAWEWYQNNPKETNVDNGDVEVGDADVDLDKQAQVATVAAAYLFALTGDQTYHDYFKANYKTTWPMSDAYWGLYFGEQADGVMFYTTLPNADPAVKAYILERRDLHDFTQSLEDNDDLYRSYVPDFSYHWGSLQVRARSGASSYDFYQYDINPAKRDNFYKKAQNVLHYFHGVNPFAFTYLTNMQAYGAENSIKQIYHSWFADNTQWDNAPPGYIPGGPSEQYTGTESPPRNQPAQKTYKDWNGIVDQGAHRDISWEITENGIYYQAGYIKLLAKFVTAPGASTQAPQTPANLTATAAESTTALQLNWSRSLGATSYDVELDGVVRENVKTLFITHDGLQPGTEHSYRVRAKNAIGASAWSPLVIGTTSVPPLPPETPTGLKAVPASAFAITVSWNESDRTKKYELEVDGTVVNNAKQTTYKHKGLDPVSTHTYRVRAINLGGVSAWSAPVTATTPVAPPTSVIDLSHNGNSGYTFGQANDQVKRYQTFVADMYPVLTSVEVMLRKFGNATDATVALHATDADGKPTGNALATGTIAANTVTEDFKAMSVPLKYSGLQKGKKYALVLGQVTPNSQNYIYEWLAGYNVSNDTEFGKFNGSAYIDESELGDGWTKLYVAQSADPQQPPAVPTGVTATAASSTSITLGWTAVTGATSYQIEVDGSSTYVSATGTSYTHSGLAAGSTHKYRVRAVNAAGTSGWSALATATTSQNPQPPAVPTGVTATAASTSSITLGWNAVTGATGYQIEIDGSSTYVSATGTSYTHSGLAAGSTHTYRVRAVNAAGASGWSAAATATTNQNQPQPPAVPTGLTATAASSTSIALGWNAVTGATSYQIEIDGATTYVSMTGASYTHSGLAAGSTHTYRVRAVNAAGASAWSAVASATTPGQSSSSVIDISHNGTDGYTFGETSDQVKRYQTFKANSNANITKLEVKVKKYNNPANLTVSLYATKSDKPTGSALATVTVKASDIGEDFALVSVPLTYSGLVNGTTYAIVLGQSKNSDYANYEWCTSEVSAALKYGKYSGGKWIDESGIGDGWLKVYVGQ